MLVFTLLELPITYISKPGLNTAEYLDEEGNTVYIASAGTWFLGSIGAALMLSGAILFVARLRDPLLL